MAPQCTASPDPQMDVKTIVLFVLVLVLAIAVYMLYKMSRATTEKLSAVDNVLKSVLLPKMDNESELDYQMEQEEKVPKRKGRPPKVPKDLPPVVEEVNTDDLKRA